MKKSKKKSGAKKAKAASKRGAKKKAVRVQEPKPAKAATDKRGEGKTTPGTTHPKGAKRSAIQAAAEVLQRAGKPMGCKELIEAMAEQGLWKSPAGKTPHATLYSAIVRSIATQGSTAKFKKVDRGLFAFKEAGK